ncbi:hypothetical protein GCM10011315_15760 [Roseovarius pacificus]|nr:hypothetical protein GCM10011315_15760 [Roseovarius pacificus]
MTVGPGVSPDLLTPGHGAGALAGSGRDWPHTAGGEFRPALRTVPIIGDPRTTGNPENAYARIVSDTGAAGKCQGAASAHP